MSHFPRVPLNKQYPDLYKGSLVGTSMTDNVTRQPLPAETYTPEYRSPADRVSGNVVFRRMPDGSIDMEAAVDVVTSCLNQLKFKGPLNDQECRILCCVFPETMSSVISNLDGRMSVESSKTRFRVSEEELKLIAAHVAVRILEQHEWLRYGPKL